MLNATRNETRELLAKAHADATRELQEAEAKGSRLLEQSRHQATELTNAARAEVEQTLEWARAQASAVLARAQHGSPQSLSAAGLGDEAIGTGRGSDHASSRRAPARPCALSLRRPRSVAPPRAPAPEEPAGAGTTRLLVHRSRIRRWPSPPPRPARAARPRRRPRMTPPRTRSRPSHQP